MSYLLHLCNIHLSPLTGPGSSIYPSYLYPHSVSPHSVSLTPDRLPPALSELRRKKWGWNTNGSHIDAGPCFQVAPGFDTSQRVQSQHGALIWAVSQPASQPWSVVLRRACDALARRAKLRLASCGESLRHGVMACVCECGWHVSVWLSKEPHYACLTNRKLTENTYKLIKLWN